MVCASFVDVSNALLQLLPPLPHTRQDPNSLCGHRKQEPKFREGFSSKFRKGVYVTFSDRRVSGSDNIPIIASCDVMYRAREICINSS